MGFEDLPVTAMVCIAAHLQAEVNRDVEKCRGAEDKIPGLDVLRQVSHAVKAAVDACVQLVNYELEPFDMCATPDEYEKHRVIGVRDPYGHNCRLRLAGMSEEQQFRVVERAFQADAGRWPCLSRVSLHCRWHPHLFDRFLGTLGATSPDLVELSLLRVESQDALNTPLALLPNLVNLRALKTLRLRNLGLGAGGLCYVAQMPSLEELRLYEPRSGLYPALQVPRMPRLKTLHWHGRKNNIATLEDLPNWASLEVLYLKNVTLSGTFLELPPLISSLVLKEASVPRLSLSRPEVLRRLCVFGGNLRELPDLSLTTQLQDLNLAALVIATIPGIETCKSLTSMRVGLLPMFSASPELDNLTSLVSLAFYDGRSYPRWAGCPSLQTLSIPSPRHLTVEMFEGLTNLKRLTVGLPLACVTVRWGDARGGELVIDGNRVEGCNLKRREHVWRWFLGVLQDARPLSVVEGIEFPLGGERVPTPDWNYYEDCDDAPDGDVADDFDGDDVDDDEDSEDDDSDDDEWEEV